MRAAFMLAAIAAAAVAAPAAAQTVGIGTTQGGATSQVATAIATLVSTKAGLQMRPQPYANTAQYIPVVNAGRLEFGVSNVVQALYAVKGQGMSAGRPHPDLRLVAVLFPFEATLFVAEKSGIRTMAGLKGRSVPTFTDESLGDFIMKGFLANAGVPYEQVKTVKVPNFPRMWDAFKEGAIDTMIATVGSRPTFEAKAALGELVALPIDPGPAAMAELRKFLPQAYAVEVKADAKLPGMAADRWVMAFDYVLWAHKGVPDEVVAKVAAVLHDYPGDLHASAPIWRSFKPAGMAKDVGLPWHPGAAAYLKQRGVMK
jgi:uncharacterized protein